ncbi:MAG: class I SAM-dependent methyltransferase [Steroidobacteraceae bacterium]
MTTARQHYDQHLARIYSWMVGDPDAAMERNLHELRALGIATSLKERAGSGANALPIQCVVEDLACFRAHSDAPVDLVLCMGDTLTQLASRAAVEGLLDRVAAALRPGGMFIATFRDYATHALEGPQRFIPVRNDEDRILTCFLEYGNDTVTVYDLLQERQAEGWLTRISCYPKLRLDPAWVVARLASRGLRVKRDVGAGAMVRIVARSAAQ